METQLFIFYSNAKKGNLTRIPVVRFCSCLPKAAIVLLLLLSFTCFRVYSQTVPLGEASKFAILAGGAINANTQVHGHNYVGAGEAISENVTAVTAVVPEAADPVPRALEGLVKARDYCNSYDAIILEDDNLSGHSLGAGVYSLNGNGYLGDTDLTLTGSSTSIYIFNISGDLIIDENALLNFGNVKPKNIFWNVGGSVTIKTNATFAGIVMAGNDINFDVPSGLQLALLSLSTITITSNSVGDASYLSNFYSFDELSRASAPCEGPTFPNIGFNHNSVKERITTFSINLTSFGTDALNQPLNSATFELELTSNNNTIYTVSVSINTLGQTVYPDFTTIFNNKYKFKIPCGSYTVRTRVYNSCTSSTSTFFNNFGSFTMNVNCFTITLPDTEFCSSNSSTIQATVVNHPDLTGNVVHLHLQGGSPTPIKWYWNGVLIPGASSSSINVGPSIHQNQTGNLTVSMGLTVDGFTITETQSSIVIYKPALTGATVLGNPNQLTIIDASTYPNNTVDFNGIYHIKGQLELKNGTFNINPGTTFYFDPGNAVDPYSIGVFWLSGYDAIYPGGYTIPGYFPTILKVSNATLNIEAATLTTACGVSEKWGGVYITDNSSIYTKGANLTVGGQSVWTKSEISNALVGVGSADVSTAPVNPDFMSWNTNYYQLKDTRFVNNHFGFQDRKKELPAQAGEGITDCIFEGCATAVYFEAVDCDCAPGGSFSGDYTLATYKDNIIRNNEIGMYGHAKNMKLEDNQFLNNSNMAVNIVVNGWLPPYNARLDITGNTFVIPATAMGIIVNAKTDITNNTVIGANGGTGIYSSGLDINTNNTEISGNRFSSLEYAVTMFPGTYLQAPYYTPLYAPQTNVTGNIFTNNLAGIRFPHDAYTTGAATVKCNTFNSGSIGVKIEPGSKLNQIGATGNPGGNHFNFVTTAIRNDASVPFDYYYYSGSSHESAASIIIGTNVQAQSTSTTSSVILANYCSGFMPGAGASQRNSGPNGNTYADILEMMDSLRLNLGSLNDLKYFQREIIAYHAGQNLLANLETYTHTLQGQNQEAYNTIGLYLMQTYRAQGQKAQAQTLKNALVFYNPQDAEITARAKYFDMSGRWNGAQPPLGRLAPQDSADLADIAASGTMLSEQACFTLRIFYPQVSPCSTPTIAARQTAANTPVPAKGKESRGLVANALGQSYPNPAQGEAVIPYTLPASTQYATITINDVVTGRVVKSYRVDVTARELAVDLRSLTNGLYIYTLTADGKPLGTRKLSVVK